MPKVGSAFGADDFFPSHAVSVIHLDIDGCLIDRIPEAGPTGTGLILGLRFEQLGTAADTSIGAILLMFVVFTGEREFRGLLLGHSPLFLGEALLKVCFVHGLFKWVRS